MNANAVSHTASRRHLALPLEFSVSRAICIVRITHTDELMEQRAKPRRYMITPDWRRHVSLELLGSDASNAERHAVCLQHARAGNDFELVIALVDTNERHFVFVGFV